MADPSDPLLIFDSGVGGLTILAEVRKTLPDAPVIYAADFAGLPYGTKSEAEVAARVCGLLGRMAEAWRNQSVPSGFVGVPVLVLNGPRTFSLQAIEKRYERKVF